MNKNPVDKGKSAGSVVPTQDGGIRHWQLWTPYGAITWSLVYAVLGGYWAASGRGFPYTPENMTEGTGALVGKFGPGLPWIVVIMAGIPAAVLGVMMLRGVRDHVLRSFFIFAGAILSSILLLLMTDLNLLILLGYTPSGIVKLITGDAFGQVYLGMLAQWTVVHQLLCLIGGFLWLGATVSYARRSGDACLYCGRRDGLEGWRSPDQAARWGRIAVYVAMLVPVFYAAVRYAWVLGFPLGIDAEQFSRDQGSANWISGALFLGTFALVGAALMLGLVQRWGEVFPRWMIGLSGRRVPIALAVVPASIVSVLLIVGGVVLWSDLGRIVTGLAANGAKNMEIMWIILFQAGPVLLFPVWGVSLVIAALGYYYRRRGPCSVCGRGASTLVGEPSSSYQLVT